MLRMTEQAVKTQIVQRWYTRPVLFVADVNRALHFYIDGLTELRREIIERSLVIVSPWRVARLGVRLTNQQL